MHKRKTVKNEGIYVSPLTIVLAVALVLLGHGIALLSYAAALLPHEYAHACVAEKLGYRLRRVRIMPHGVSLGGEDRYIKPLDEAKIAAAGPVVNIAIFVLLAAVWWFFPAAYAATESIAYASLFTAAVNLLPVFPMDGGRILHGVLYHCFSAKKAGIISRIVSIFTGTAALCCAFVMLVTGVNASFATLGIFVLASLMMPSDGGLGRMYAMNEMKVRLRGGLPVREIMVSQDSTPAELFAMLRPDRYTRFMVCDDAGTPLFAVGEGDLERMIIQFSCSDTVISLAKRALL